MFEKKISDKEKKNLEKEAKKRERVKKKEAGSTESKVPTAVKVLLIPALFAGVVCMLIYVAMEDKAAEANLKGKAVIMTEDVAANTYVSEGDIGKYFTEISVDLTAIPENAYSSLSDLPSGGFYIENTMKKAQMVFEDDLSIKDSVMDKYKNGYEVTSFATDSFDGGVNGSLRKGDIVDVYALDPATEMLTLMAEDVYVNEVYDSSGNIVTEPEGIATSFTVYVTPNEVESINQAVVFGGVQMYLKVDS